MSRHSKQIMLVILTISILSSATLTSALAASPFTNFGFETGDLAGWTAAIPPEGHAVVVSSYTSDASTVYIPAEGDYFADLKTDGSGSYTSLKQTVDLAAGEKITGSAAFDSQDYLPYNDNAMVQILDSAGAAVATPWYSDVSIVGNYGQSPWTSWSWTATDSGTYTLEYRITNSGDSVLDSHALFDGPQTFTGTNMYLSKHAPPSMDHGNTMVYTVFYNNFGDTAASDVTLQDTLPPGITFVSASDGGTYDSSTQIVTWDIGTVPAFPSGTGTRTVTVTIPSSAQVGTVIANTATISTTTTETKYNDNSANAQTIVTGSTLPPNTAVGPTVGNSAGEPIVHWTTPVTFSYYDALATSVDIKIHLDDGGPDITGAMSGPAPTWTYSITFYPRHGEATVTYTPHYPDGSSETIAFNIYVDPAGYVYDVTTGDRIAGATVWLQRPDGAGGWENVPVGEVPAVMLPDTNPLVTDVNGQYQWDTLPGTYRVHVEAPGYYPADSIVVNVPPPVFDLNVGLTPVLFVIPESVLGTLMAVLVTFAAFAVVQLGLRSTTANYTKRPRLRSSTRKK